MSELLIGIRRAALSLYRRLPGRPLARPLVALDRWVKGRFAGKKVTAERGGLHWELDLDQHIDRHIYLEGFFERGTTAALDALTREGMTVLDIGANIGAHCLPLARRVGPGGRVYAFEPTEWAFGKLQRNLSLNPELRNVVPERMALSDADQDQAAYAFQSQYKAQGDSLTEQGAVTFSRLDTYCARKGIAKVDLIKLDVDGFETKILRGATEILRRDRPIMIVEVSDYWQRKAGDSFEALLGLLGGYDFFELDGTTPVVDIRARIAALGDRDAINVICRPHP